MFSGSTMFFSPNPPLHEFDLQRYDSSDTTTVEADLELGKDKEGDDDEEDDDDDRNGFTHLFLPCGAHSWVFYYLPSVIFLR